MAKFELFIANRFNREERDNQQMSRPAVRIAIIGISLGLAVMLISIAVIVGFKREVRNQIIGFGSHIQIMSYNNYNSLQSEPVTLTPQLDSLLKTTPNISDIQHIATQPGIIHTEEAFQGILLKGVDSTYNWDFFSQNLLEGATLNSQSSTPNSSLISASIARAMNLKIGDSYTVYFASNNGLRARKFTVLGIYQTTFADYDKLYIITNINHIQRLNQWREDQFSTLEILINDYTQLNQTSAELFNRIITYSHNTDILYRVETIESLTPQIFDWLAMLDMNAIVIIILMLAVSGFCVISGLLILILERSATIGLLKSQEPTIGQFAKSSSHNQHISFHVACSGATSSDYPQSPSNTSPMPSPSTQPLTMSTTYPSHSHSQRGYLSTSASPQPPYSCS